MRWPLRQLHPARFHRLFASAPWSLDQVGLTLFMLMLGFLPEGAAIFLGAETPWFEEPQGWSRKAVERTAPLVMLLSSLYEKCETRTKNIS